MSVWLISQRFGFLFFETARHPPLRNHQKLSPDNRQGIRRVVRSLFSSPGRVAISTGDALCLFDVLGGYLVENGTLSIRLWCFKFVIRGDHLWSGRIYMFTYSLAFITVRYWPFFLLFMAFPW